MRHLVNYLRMLQVLAVCNCKLQFSSCCYCCSRLPCWKNAVEEHEDDEDEDDEHEDDVLIEVLANNGPAPVNHLVVGDISPEGVVLIEDLANNGPAPVNHSVVADSPPEDVVLGGDLANNGPAPAVRVSSQQPEPEMPIIVTERQGNQLN